MAKLSVGGKVELDYAPSGLIWRLTCPAANALERGVAKKAAELPGPLGVLGTKPAALRLA